jgi:ATP-dependent Zn protease
MNATEEAVKRVLRELSNEAAEIVTDNLAGLHTLARQLLAERYLSGRRVRRILRDAGVVQGRGN